MKRIFALLLMLSLSTFCVDVQTATRDPEEMDKIIYGAEGYNDYREITYWGLAEFTIRDYHYQTRDAEALKLVVKQGGIQQDPPRPDLRDHFIQEFRKFFGDLPFRDVKAGWDERFYKFQRENGGQFTPELMDKFEATEEARRRALYGGRAGAFYCHVRVKRRVFPVLYEIRCSMSAANDLSYLPFREAQDIGFGTPELIDREIKTAVTAMLEKKSTEMKKIRKFGKQ
jgi:hypothetical protein